MPSIYTIIASWSWFVLFIVWLPGYFTSKKTIKRPNAVRQFVATALIFLSFAFLFSYNITGLGVLSVRVTPYTALLGIFGGALNIVGIAFAIWARLTLGRNWSGIITLKQGHELIQVGPYAIVRHPIYTGMFFGMLGIAITIGLLMSYIGVILGFIAFLVRVKDEDELMAKEFSEYHPAYRQKTKKLFPFIW